MRKGCLFLIGTKVLPEQAAPWGGEMGRERGWGVRRVWSDEGEKMRIQFFNTSTVFHASY